MSERLENVKYFLEIYTDFSIPFVKIDNIWVEYKYGETERDKEKYSSDYRQTDATL